MLIQIPQHARCTAIASACANIPFLNNDVRSMQCWLVSLLVPYCDVEIDSMSGRIGEVPEFEV